MPKLNTNFDVMSNVLSLVRLRGELFCANENSAPWSLAFRDQVSRFHIVDRGTVFTDTIALTNLGPSDAHNIVVTIKPVLGLTFQSYGSYPTCAVN